MPKREEYAPATCRDFDTMRLRAMLAPPSEPLRKEVQDLDWADFGRSVYANMYNAERFKKAIVIASLKADTVPKGEGGDHFIRILRLYLTTGTIGNV